MITVTLKVRQHLWHPASLKNLHILSKWQCSDELLLLPSGPRGGHLVLEGQLRRIKHFSTRIRYHTNEISTFNPSAFKIIRSGDVETNPGDETVNNSSSNAGSSPKSLRCLLLNAWRLRTHPHFNSDHFAVSFNIKLLSGRARKSVSRKNYNFKKVDFTAPNELLRYIPWNCAFLEEDVDSCTERVNDLLLAAADMCIPTFTVKKNTNPPWVTKEILNNIKKKKKVMEQTKGSSIRNP